MQVVARIELPGERVERVVERAAVECAKSRAWPVGDAADGEANAVFARNRGAGDDGEIAVAAGELPEGVAVSRPPRRYGDRFDQFVVGARAVDIRPVKKFAAATLRRLRRDDNSTSPSSASRTSGISALGSACAIEPHTVPRLRVCA